MRTLVACLAAAWLLAPVEARAVCGIQLQGVSFGTIDVMRREESTGSVRVSCDEAVAFSVEIGGGSTGGERRMYAAGGGSLRYQLYADAATTRPWGDGLTVGSAVGGSSDGANPQTFTIYGVIPSQPGTLPGVYTDSPLVTLGF
ncbi:MAG TPA: spore coat U domain-containing protein [Geminicoccaceae bacterium]|nr:spore coat U domain-containing protein [Geminicoccus sp.]HMU49063.1 spore coat U domain-containing protein [Geminicoccaceae bacterium]